MPTLPDLPVDRREVLAVFVGGAAGAVLRVWLASHLAQAPTGWPWTIFAINVTGSFALGYLATRLPHSTYRRLLLGIGFCGAYTTFSTVQIEAVTLVDAHRYGLAVGYALASITAGLVAIWASTKLARRARIA